MAKMGVRKLSLLVLALVTLAAGFSLRFSWKWSKTKAAQTSQPKVLRKDDSSQNEKTMRLEGVEKAKAASFERTILDFEKNDSLSDECRRYGGNHLVEELRKGKENVCRGEKSAIDWYSMRPVAENQDFGVLVLTNAAFKRADQGPKYKIELECAPTAAYSERIVRLHQEKATKETKDLVQSIDTEGIQCARPEGVLIFVDSNDYYNWWWFLVQLQNHFLAMAALWTELDDEPHTIVFQSKDGRLGSDATSKDNHGQMGLREMYRKMFGREGMLDVRTWINADDAFGCYRTIIVMRNAENGSPILKNARHNHDHCFSPVIAALRSHMRASVGLKDQNSQSVRRVCWASRDEEDRREYTSWQVRRTVRNQTGLVAALDEYARAIGAEVVQIPFYAFNDAVPVSTQMKRASQCSLVAGIHGAGLYVAVAMTKLSILEFVPLPIANRNAVNLKHLVGGCYRGQIRVKLNAQKQIAPALVWKEVHTALHDCGDG